MTATKQNICYCGLHIGCPNATSSDCRTCAEHVTYAVDHVAHEATTRSVGTHKEEDPRIDVATRSRRVSVFSRSS